MKHYTIRLPWVTLRATTDRPAWRAYAAMVVHEVLELTPGVDAHANRWAVAYALGLGGTDMRNLLLHDGDIVVDGYSLRDKYLHDAGFEFDPDDGGAQGTVNLHDLTVHNENLHDLGAVVDPCGVVVHPADENGCGTYRMILPAQALAAQGHDVTIEFDYKYQGLWQDTVFGAQLIGLAEDVDADVVVIQRPLQRHRYELMRALQAKGVTVVVEVDDDFHAVHRRNPAWKHSNPLHDPDNNRDWLMRACRDADLVTVSTPALAARYGGHGRVRVLPNYVPAAYCTIEPGEYTDEHLERLTGTVIGWTGSVHTHPDDLDQTGGAVQTVLERTGARFHVIGTGVRVQKALGLSQQPSSTGWLPLVAYPEAIRQLDIGIVPLAGHAFNEAKSWLKGLEFASLGVPFVATPTGPYRALAEYGLGYLASHPNGWATYLERLVRDVVLREELSIRGREIVAEHLTIEGQAWQWLEAWADARARVAA